LLATSFTPASAVEYAKPSWIAETGAPTDLHGPTGCLARSDYQMTDCIEAVYWVKADGSKVAGLWASKNDFTFANFTQLGRLEQWGKRAVFQRANSSIW
jgi:hypothetical protein